MECPSFLSPEARHFITCTLVRDPQARPSITQLLGSPLIMKYVRKRNEQLQRSRVSRYVRNHRSLDVDCYDDYASAAKAAADTQAPQSQPLPSCAAAGAASSSSAGAAVTVALGGIVSGPPSPTVPKLPMLPAAVCQAVASKFPMFSSPLVMSSSSNTADSNSMRTTITAPSSAYSTSNSSGAHAMPSPLSSAVGLGAASTSSGCRAGDLVLGGHATADSAAATAYAAALHATGVTNLPSSAANVSIQESRPSRFSFMRRVKSVGGRF